MSDIVKCTCKHSYQDSLYGIGNRVANSMRTGQSKCTVCGTVHGSQSVVKSAKIKDPVVKEIVKVEKKSEVKDEKKKDDKKKSVKGGKR